MTLDLCLGPYRLLEQNTIDWVASDFIFWGSKITADGDCSHEFKRRLLLGRKALTNLDSILKRRDIVNKGLSSQGYGFTMYECESWTIKKAEH